jgi:type II secretory pathway pseudopilin PulG
MSRHSLRGLSAVEAIMTIALFAVIAVLLVGAFTRSLRISARESVNLEMEQTCHFLLQQVQHDLTQSGTSGISYLNDSQWHGVGINPIEDITSEGTLVWQGTQILYVWNRSKETLFKQNLATSKDPLANPVNFTPEEFAGLASNPSPTRAAIGERVKVFQVVNRRADGSGRLVDVAVELQRDLPNDGPRNFRLDRLVTVLN